MKTNIHALAASIAFLTILTFFSSTVVVEIIGSPADIAWVKANIVLGLFILIPAMAVTGATGGALSQSRKGKLVDAKKKRMPIIAANGLLILVPCTF